MSISFSGERWQQVGDTHRAWWSRELKRPLIHLALADKDPGRAEPALPSYGFVPFYDQSVTAESIIDRYNYDLSRVRWFGDAFPVIFPNFGPGVVAAFIGASLGTSIEAGTCWFHLPETREIEELTFTYDPDNVWLGRVTEFCEAAVERWQGLVQVSMTDLGGNLDILSSFRPSEMLMYDLYDHPDDVKRLTWDLHELWWRYFDEINSIVRQSNPGYTAWTPILSPEPYYMLQCDFSYMIGPDMFDEFVRPEIAASCKRLGNSFYHLDGPGELPHLDSLLSIPELDGIQWIPGAGAPGLDCWPEVFRKIRDAGKLTQVYGSPYYLDKIVEQTGTAENIIFTGSVLSEREAMDCLKKYKAI